MRKKDRFTKPKYFLLFTPLFLLYLYTCPSTVFWQDSGIYLAGVKTLGIIYPPGYPLYLISAKVWVAIFSFATANKFTYAWYVHSFSALMGVIACYFVFLTVTNLTLFIERILYSTNKKYVLLPANSRLIISLTAAYACGFSYSLWSQSINSEVYSMVGMFASITFYLIINLLVIKYRKDWGDAKVNYFKTLIMLTVVTSLSFANHPLSVIISIPVIWVVLRIIGLHSIRQFGVTRILILGLAFILIVGGCYSFLFIRSGAERYYLWNRIGSVDSFWYHITGREYYQGNSPIGFSFQRFISFFVLFFQEMFVAAPILLILGIRSLKRISNHTRTLTIFVPVFSLSIYLASLAYKTGGTEYNYWLIPVYILFYIICGVGLWSLISSPTRRHLKILIVLIFLITPLVVNIFYNNRRNYVLAQEFGKNILRYLPKNSILFTVGDQDSSITKYLEIVEGYKTDVVLIRPAEFSDVWRIKHIQKFYPNIVIPESYRNATSTVSDYESFLNEFIKENMEFTSIFLIQKSLIDLNKLEGIYTVPFGTIWKLSKKEDEIIDLNVWNYDFSDSGRYFHPERTEGARKIYDRYGIEGSMRQRYSDEAKNFELQSKKNLGDICLDRSGKGKYLKVKLTDGSFDQWQGRRLLGCAKDAYEKMLKIDPKFYHEQVFLNLSKAYEGLGMTEQSKKYYNEVLLRKNKGVR